LGIVIYNENDEYRKTKIVTTKILTDDSACLSITSMEWFSTGS
jgi:hypothetical protein